MALRIGVLTISDRVSAQEMEDRGATAIAGALQSIDHQIAQLAVVPDERARIQDTLTAWCDDHDLDVIFTTGGTGLGPRDVTPEATAAVCSYLVPGIAENLRAAGLQDTPQSMLSRAVAGVRGRTLIVNLPGSPAGASDGVEVLLPVLEHAVAIMHGGKH
ncbi:MAG: MogA/MoaB family molybdenum cofactor biosynthesis protein [Chloroflexota bacterium]